MASNTTRDHDFIREWTEKRGGKPAEVASTETENQVGILRLEFPDAPHANDDALKEISWEDFFEKFDESGLEFLYQEETADGEQSNFNKLVYPDPESSEGKSLLRKVASKKRAGKSAAKGSAKKATAKKGTKSAPAKVAAKKSAAKTVATKKTPAKKTVAKKVAGKKAPAKVAPKKAAKKVPAKKTAAKSTAKAPAKKTAAKKTATKKTAARRGR